MNLLVVVLLGGLWASILLPGVLRGRRNASPVNSVHLFEQRMRMLNPDRASARARNALSGRHVLVLDDPAGVAVGSSRKRTLRRRRAVLAALGIAVLTTGVLALLLGGVLIALFAACLTAACAYLAVLLQLRSHELSTRRTVRRLPVAGVHDDSEDADMDLYHAHAVGQSRTVRVRHWDG